MPCRLTAPTAGNMGALFYGLACALDPVFG